MKRAVVFVSLMVLGWLLDHVTQTPQVSANFIATGTALAIGAAASAASSVAGGVLANKGANAQARAAENATAMSVAEQKRQYDLSRADMQPWVQRGNAAGDYLQFLMGLSRPQLPAGSNGAPTPRDMTLRYGRDNVSSYPSKLDYPNANDRELMDYSYDPASGSYTAAAGPQYNPAEYGSLNRDFTLADFTKDPGYDFRLGEGTKAVERSAAARGMSLSGAQLKGLTRFNQDFASNEFSNAYNRFRQNKQDRYNMLSGIAGTGQNTAVNLGALGQQTSQSIGNTIIGGQTAAAAARASGYNATANAIGGAGNTFSNYLMLQSLMNKPTTSTPRFPA